MIKKVIFDIDNTLMDFPKHFDIGFKSVLDKFNLSIEPIELYKAVGTYETSGKFTYYNKEDLLDVINKVLNLNLEMDFVDDFFNMFNKLITEIPIETIETLKYSAILERVDV